MALWPRVYTRKKRAYERLCLTPTPHLGTPTKVEAPSGPDGRLPAHWKPILAGPKGSGKVHDLAKISEKAEQSRLRGSSSGPLSTQLRVSGEKSLQENSSSEETQDENISPLNESVTDNLQVDSSSSNSELVSGLSWQRDASTSLLSYSVTDSYIEYKSSEESLSSFPKPELFRGSDHLDWECPRLEEHMLYKNSTLLDTSKAVVIEKASQFLNLSAILELSDTDFQTMLSSHLKFKIPSSYQRHVFESNTGKSATKVLLPQPLEPVLIDLSPVKSTAFEELFPNISNYVNSDEIVPVSSLQENSSNKFPSSPSEICCIIRASPGTRQVKSKGIVLKKKYSPPKDIPQGTVI
ncbi:Meiosis-specific kinetochore protein [Galemys pyrenaicus]|uniref:Meiosis-specific kinetochore protein n=1 Tax=Galemys pyrenaicus TaxID=202257 RepID=A0A8J5ZZJ3_GALPY|nr:Meiosis-specific kinetochore protein [Galemys pyrenaicus]